jgi:hypothetical protein
VVHIDEGIDFLGWRIKRQRRGSDGRHFVYTYPSKRSLAAVKAKVMQITAVRTQPDARRAAAPGEQCVPLASQVFAAWEAVRSSVCEAEADDGVSRGFCLRSGS